MSMCLCGYVCMSMDALGWQSRASDALKLELQAVVNHQLWVLGTEELPTLLTTVLSLRPLQFLKDRPQETPTFIILFVDEESNIERSRNLSKVTRWIYGKTGLLI